MAKQDDFIADDFVADDFVPDDHPHKESLLQHAGQFAKTAAERGPVTAAREAFDRNPEPVLNALPLAGGIIGQAVLPIPGVGMGVGAMTGEAYKQLGRRAYGLSSPATSDAAAESIAKEGVYQGVLDALTFGAAKAAPAVGEALAPAGRAAAKVGQMVTGVEAQKIIRLAKDPAAMLPSWLGGPKPIKKAGEALGKAIDSTGLINETSPFFKKNEVAEELWHKVKAHALGQGPEPTPQEIFVGKRAVDEVLDSTPWSQRHGKLWGDRVAFKNHLREELGKFSGDVAKASGDYARSALRRDFMSPVPINQSGTPSILRSGIGTGLAKAAGLPFAAGLAMSSPLAIGAGVAAVSGAIKAAAKPAVQRGLSAIVGDALARRAKPQSKGASQSPLRVSANVPVFNSIEDAWRASVSLPVGQEIQVGGQKFRLTSPGRDRGKNAPKALEALGHVA